MPPFRCDSTSNSACGPPVELPMAMMSGKGGIAGMGRNTTAAGSIDRGRGKDARGAGSRSLRRPGRLREPARRADTASAFTLLTSSR